MLGLNQGLQRHSQGILPAWWPLLWQHAARVAASGHRPLFHCLSLPRRVQIHYPPCSDGILVGLDFSPCCLLSPGVELFAALQQPFRSAQSTPAEWCWESGTEASLKPRFRLHLQPLHQPPWPCEFGSVLSRQGVESGLYAETE